MLPSYNFNLRGVSKSSRRPLNYYSECRDILTSFYELKKIADGKVIIAVLQNLGVYISCITSFHARIGLLKKIGENIRISDHKSRSMCNSLIFEPDLIPKVEIIGLSKCIRKERSLYWRSVRCSPEK